MTTFWLLYLFVLVFPNGVTWAEKQNDFQPVEGTTPWEQTNERRESNSPPKKDIQSEESTNGRKQDSSSSSNVNVKKQDFLQPKGTASSLKPDNVPPEETVQSLKPVDDAKQGDLSQTDFSSIPKPTLAEEQDRFPPQGVSQSSKPIHVAIVAGCNSHFSLTVPFSFALTKTATVKNKYRVTYVTSANCKNRVERVGGKLHDTGNWYYPITDPDIGYLDFVRNFSMGALKNIIPSLESLVIKDRPDIVLVEMGSHYSATIAEKYDIPFAATIPASTVLAQTCKMGKATTAMLTPKVILNEDNAPLWAINFVCNICYYTLPVISHFIIHEASAKINEIRRELKLKEYDSIMHSWTSYPFVLTIGEPLSPASDIEGKLKVVGLLPVAKSTLDSVDPELRFFIETSQKPLLYVALGTYFAFSEDYFEEIERMFEKQDLFNVLWSHSRWTPELDEKLDKQKFFIRPKLPQKEILDTGKVKLFISHCGASSMAESLQAGVPIIGVPQGRDQFSNARTIQRNKIGVELDSEPTQDDLLKAIEFLHSNWDTYHANMKQIRDKMSHNSQEKLEKFVDDLVAKGYNVNFLEEELLYPLVTGFVVVLLGILTLLSPFILISFCLCRLCCRKCRKNESPSKENKKKKTN